MKLLTSENYFDEVKKLFSNESELDIAVAFLGYDVLDLFEESKNKKIRLLCNFESGACNPHLITKLRELPNIELKSDSHLHSKLAVQDEVAIIGSANYSANGLSLEGAELSAWSELGLRVRNSKVINESKSWFSDLWSKAKKITDSDISRQLENWKSRRSTRPLINTDQSLIEVALNEHPQFLDRDIYFAIYREFASTEASIAFDEVAEESVSTDGTLSFYENWPELPDNSYLISLYVGPRGGLNFDGLYYMPSKPIIRSFSAEDGSESTIKICAPIDNIMGYKLTGKDKKQIKDKLVHITNEEPEDGSAYVVPLSDWIVSVKNGI